MTADIWPGKGPFHMPREQSSVQADVENTTEEL